MLDADTGTERVLTPADRSSAALDTAVASAIAEAMPQTSQPQSQVKPACAVQQPTSEPDVTTAGLAVSQAGASQSGSVAGPTVASSEELGPATPLARSQSLPQVSWDTKCYNAHQQLLYWVPA